MGDKGVLNRYQHAEDYNRVNMHLKTAFMAPRDQVPGHQGKGVGYVKIPAEVIIEMERTMSPPIPLTS